MIDTENKGARLLDMYERLSHGEVISKKELAEIYGVTVKTIQRDIDELRAYLAEKSLQGDRGTIEYSPAKKGYRLIRSTYEHLNHKEILALAKILLESRALEPGELHTILDKLTATCIEKDRTTVVTGHSETENPTYPLYPPRRRRTAPRREACSYIIL